MSANTETHSAGIADVLASVPLMLGATPRNSTIVMAFKDQILVLTAQVHHSQGGITEALDKTMRVSAQHGCDAVLCAAYGMNQEDAAWSAECAANAAEDHGLQIMAQVHVEPNLRMYSDAAGHWHQLPTVQQSQTLAVHAANHPSPADSMEDLTAEWNRHGSVITAQADQGAAMRALVTILTGCCPVARELGALAGWLDAVENRDELAHVLADLPNPGQPLTIPAQIRELVSGADPETVRIGLRRACNALAAPAATQLLTIAAAHSYRRGNGMIARIQAEAAVTREGNTRLARLLLFTVNAGIPHPALKTN